MFRSEQAAGDSCYYRIADADTDTVERTWERVLSVRSLLQRNGAGQSEREREGELSAHLSLELARWFVATCRDLDGSGISEFRKPQFLACFREQVFVLRRHRDFTEELEPY